MSIFYLFDNQKLENICFSISYLLDVDSYNNNNSKSIDNKKLMNDKFKDLKEFNKYYSINKFPCAFTIVNTYKCFNDLSYVAALKDVGYLHGKQDIELVLIHVYKLDNENSSNFMSIDILTNILNLACNNNLSLYLYKILYNNDGLYILTTKETAMNLLKMQHCAMAEDNSFTIISKKEADYLDQSTKDILQMFKVADIDDIIKNKDFLIKPLTSLSDLQLLYLKLEPMVDDKWTISLFDKSQGKIAYNIYYDTSKYLKEDVYTYLQNSVDPVLEIYEKPYGMVLVASPIEIKNLLESLITLYNYEINKNNDLVSDEISKLNSYKSYAKLEYDKICNLIKACGEFDVNFHLFKD